MRNFFVIIILCGLSLTFSSCLKSADRKPKNRVELCNWLKESVTDGIEDSTQASSVEVYEWVYVAAGKLDSIHEAYKAEGLCDGDIDSARYYSEIIYPDELESVAYQTFGNEQYLLGGFFHEPYAVYVPKDIRMDGTHRKRFPESVMTKDGYANYWQLDGEWPVWLRVYFELWYFFAGYIPTTDSYIVACRYRCKNSPRISEGSSIFFLDSDGEIVTLIPLMCFDEIMRYLNRSYWELFASTHSYEEILEHLDHVVPLGDGHAVDRFGVEYTKDGNKVHYGTDFGEWR